MLLFVYRGHVTRYCDSPLSVQSNPFWQLKGKQNPPSHNHKELSSVKHWAWDRTRSQIRTAAPADTLISGWWDPEQTINPCHAQTSDPQKLRFKKEKVGSGFLEKLSRNGEEIQLVWFFFSFDFLFPMFPSFF